LYIIRAFSGVELLDLQEFHNTFGQSTLDIRLEGIFDAKITPPEAVTISGKATISASYRRSTISESGFVRSVLSGCNGYVTLFVILDGDGWRDNILAWGIIEDSFFNSFP